MYLLCQGKKQTIHRYAYSGLAVFDITRKQFRTLIPSQNNPTSQAGNIVNEIQPYKDKLIILTQAGVYLFNPEQETFSPLTHNEDINKLLFRPYQFETFLIDSKERLWLADSKGGLLCIHMTDNSSIAIIPMRKTLLPSANSG